MALFPPSQYDFPNSSDYDSDLREVLAELRGVTNKMRDFEVINKITNAGAWDITKQYKPWTIVSDNNVGYISVRPVPAGIEITNTDYWALVADYDILITDLSERISALERKTIMDYTGDGIVFPSDNPEGNDREYLIARIPEVTRFIDNVLGIQNKSHGQVGDDPDVYGNAAIAFFDFNQVERGAIGYSRERTSQPSGYIANTLYLEGGNPFGESGTDTDIRVILTNSTNFSPGCFFPLEIISQTGATNIRARGVGGIHLMGGSAGVGIGNIADGEIGRFTIDNTASNTYIREYFSNDRVAYSYNIYTDQRDPLYADKPSLMMHYGVNIPSSIGFDTLNATGHVGLQIDYRAANSNDWYTLYRLGYDGRLFLQEYATNAGYDGQLCVSNGANNRAAATFRSNNGLQPGLLIHNKVDVGCTMMIFGSGTSYTERGSITYSSGAIHYNTTSDYRIKKIVGDASGALEKINAIKVYNGYANNSDTETNFCLAHELQKIIPEAVTGQKDEIDSEGKAILQQVDYTSLIPLIIKAIQELREENKNA